MIKVLYKAFGILELIAETPETPKSVTELAKGMGLNQPTTVRILKDLCSMGYVEQVSARKGYVLGAMAFQISSRGSYMEELLEVGRPLVKSCAESLKQSVLLSVYKSKKRFILYHENFNPNLNIEITHLYHSDFYYTATGRVQLAYLNEDELIDLLETAPLPDDLWGWDHVTDLESLKSALADVRKDGFYKGDNYGSSMRVMAFPVFKNDQYVATLGASMPDTETEEEMEKVFNKAWKTAKQITAGLSTIRSFA